MTDERFPKSVSRFSDKEARQQKSARKAFIRANTRIDDVPGLDIRLYQASEVTPLWLMTEADLEQALMPPPFWAFPWAGGQALARYILEHPDVVRG